MSEATITNSAQGSYPTASGGRPSKVAIIGAGGIGTKLIEFLAPFNPGIIAVNRSGRPVAGGDETLPMAEADGVWERADVVVLLAPLTAATRGMVDEKVLNKMKQSAVLVNVGRGPLVVTDDLVAALDNGVIAGAALDVTDPEPLPADHPLWEQERCLITPHTAVAKSASGSEWARGVEYFADFVGYYWLWLPVLGAAALAGWLLRGTGGRRLAMRSRIRPWA